MSKDAKTIKSELSMPFAPEDLEWRLQQTFEEKGRGLAVPYVTNRAIQDRLDDVVGPDNWHNDFKPWHGNGKKEAQICGISVYFESRGEWITKWDGAEDTDIEAIKGGLSDSMKRAAVQWGIGRVLYKMDTVWVDVEKRGRSWVIKASERSRLDRTYMELLKKLGLTPARPGGLQAELTPAANEKKEGRAAPAKGQEADRTQPVPASPTQSGKIMQMPSARTACEYTVLSAGVQPGMNRNAATSLTLRGQDGKTVRAFFRGADPGLVPGAELCDVKLSMKKQDSVVFYVLESFRIMDAMPKAA